MCAYDYIVPLQNHKKGSINILVKAYSLSIESSLLASVWQSMNLQHCLFEWIICLTLIDLCHSKHKLVPFGSVTFTNLTVYITWISPLAGKINSIKSCAVIGGLPSGKKEAFL